MHKDNYLLYCGFCAIVDPPSADYPLWRATIKYPTFRKYNVFEGRTREDLYDVFRMETDLVIDSLLATRFE